MTLNLQISSLDDTALLKRLRQGYDDKPERSLGESLAERAKMVCGFARQRIKQFPYYHSQFTLHDEVHMLRVTELMSMVMGPRLDRLNPIEVFLLIGAAYLHDQGMVPDADEWEQIRNSEDFKLSLQNWEVEHPNLVAIRKKISSPGQQPAEVQRLLQQQSELLDAHRTDYLRRSHGQRSEEIVKKKYGKGDTLNIGEIELASLLGRLCVSHVLPVSEITPSNGFELDERVGPYDVNMQYLAFVLRIADLLDFDRDRTPDVLYQTIHFTSEVSHLEWEKHRAVQGWEISNERIRYTMRFKHPVYHQAALGFMDYIDRELGQIHDAIDRFPAQFSSYVLGIPSSVERDRMGPLDGAYRFVGDLEFSLSRDEIVKLLMTDKLYRDRSMFVRELLQNSLDALRHRVALHSAAGVTWTEGQVTLKHFADANGNQVLSCADNGCGMDEHIIAAFLTKVGRSFYRSPEFEQERIHFRKHDVDFDPCSQFGIGFMSCFMFGDQIRILTRRDYGPGKEYGPPLEIEINGLGSLLVISDGKADQKVGTTVDVTGPPVPIYVDRRIDDVKLVDVIDGYALGTEFPIDAECALPGAARKTSIPIEIAERKSILDMHGLKNLRTYEQSFAEVHPSLRGKVRACFLDNGDGVPSLRNEEAEWTCARKNEALDEYAVKLDVHGEAKKRYRDARESATCIDGILICGSPGRMRDTELFIGHTGNMIYLGDPFVLDIRGAIKPSLTPARRPPERTGLECDPSWSKIARLATAAHSLLWERVMEDMCESRCSEEFWALALLHNAPLPWIRPRLLWQKLTIPVLTSADSFELVALPEIGHIGFQLVPTLRNEPELHYVNRDGLRLSFSKHFATWGVGHMNGSTDRMIRRLLLKMSTMTLVDGVPALVPEEPVDDSARNAVESFSVGDEGLTVPYTGQLADFISAENEAQILNRYHPLVKFAETFDECPFRELNPMQSFVAQLLHLSTKFNWLPNAVAKNFDYLDWWYCRLGSYFKAIDWSAQSKELAPPYRYWLKGRGEIQITEDILYAMAGVKVQWQPEEEE